MWSTLLACCCCFHVVACDKAAVATRDILGEWFAILVIHSLHILQHHALHELTSALHVHISLMDEDVAATSLTVGCVELSEESEAFTDIERFH